MFVNCSINNTPTPSAASCLITGTSLATITPFGDGETFINP